MHDVSERIERLICRHLDGEITTDEQLELDRVLVRSPAAQRMLQDYAAIDALSATVLKASAARRGAVALQVPPVAVRPHRRRYPWMMSLTAAAACLALFIFWHTPSAPPPGGPPAVEGSGQQVGIVDGGEVASPWSPRLVPQVGAAGGDVGVWRVVDSAAPQLDRVTNRNMIFVADETGNIYMINVDHVLELQKPKYRSGRQYAHDPI